MVNVVIERLRIVEVIMRNAFLHVLSGALAISLDAEGNRLVLPVGMLLFQIST